MSPASLLLIFPDTCRDPGLLWGLLLAAIPLILYLLERRRARPVDWPAMQFLLKDVRRTIRWMRTSELLLLLLRTALLAAIAGALSRPASIVATPARAAARGAAAAVFLIDNSHSMGWRMEGGQSLWDAAREAALKILDRHRDGDVIWIVPLAAIAEKRGFEPRRGITEARGALEALRLQGGGAAVLSGLDLAADLLSTASAAAREVFIFSDLQASSWSIEEEARWPFVLGRLRALVPPPAVAVLALESPGARVQNHALVALEAARSIVGTDKPVDLIARLQLFGPGESAPFQLQFFVDDLPVTSRTVAASAGSPVEVRFPFRFDAPGFHRVRAQTDGDAMSADDARCLSLQVVDHVPVLIAAGEGGAGRLQGKGDYLELALSPRAGEETPVETLFRPRTVPAKELGGILEAEAGGFSAPRPGESPGRLVMLADAAFLAPPAIEALERLVRQGGGLLIFCGRQADLNLYNSDWFRGGAGLLPASLAGRRSAGKEQAVSPRKLRLDHPAFGPFKEANRPELESLRIWSWLELALPPSGSTALGELSSGSPFLVEKILGRGKVLLFPISADAEDSELPERPLFVPLIHGLASYLCQGDLVTRNLFLEEEMVLELSQPEVEEGGVQVTLQNPAGALKALPILTREGKPMAAERAADPGFYTFLARAGGKEGPIVFAANLKPEESNLNRLTDLERERIERIFGFAVAPAPEALWKREGGEASRVEHWPWILGAALALAVLEILLTRHLAKSHTSWRPRLVGPAEPLQKG
ncbi:MAG: BatA domain-containing protein [Planctomycetes bacterium]|nr:BatA domain-containing protein [Planctomycetota bacterium]